VEAATRQRSTWDAKQAYAIAVVCFALGGIMGYLFHAPSSTPPAPAAALAASQHAQAALPGGTQAPSPDQLKQMAEKQAEPLLAKLKQNPNDPALLAELGKTYLYVRDFQTATDYYERSAKMKPDPRVLTTLGGAYHLSGADDKAIDAWQRALKIDPGYADALFNLGMVKWQAGSDPQAAIDAWSKLLKTNPNHPQRAQVEQMIARAKEHLNR